MSDLVGLQRLLRPVVRPVTIDTGQMAPTPPIWPERPSITGNYWAHWRPYIDSLVTLNGSDIAQLTDDTGQGRHGVQSTAVYQPARVTSTGLGGKKVARFDQSADGQRKPLPKPPTWCVTWARTSGRVDASSR